MLLQISMSAEEYAKGDRVVYKAKKDEWYAGTVTSVRAGLVGILFDDGVKASPSKPSSRTWRRLKGVKKYKTALTDQQVEAATAVAVPKVKAVPKVTPKSTAEPKAKAAKVKMPTAAAPAKAPKADKALLDPPKAPSYAWLSKECRQPLRDLDPTGISAAEYKACPILGRWYNTGRKGPTSTALIVGFGIDWKGRSAAMSITPHRTNPWLAWPVSGYAANDVDLIARKLSNAWKAEQMPYADFMRYRKQLKEYGVKQTASQEDRKEKTLQAIDKHRLSWKDVDKKEVYVEWNNGSRWHVLRGLKDDTFAVKGSGTKLRWLPMLMLRGVRDIKTYSMSAANPLVEKLNKAGVPPEVVQGLLVAQDNIIKHGDSAAKVYAKALEQSFDRYGVAGVKTQVMYMMLGAARWQGDEAKAVKKLLKKWSASK